MIGRVYFNLQRKQWTIQTKTDKGWRSTHLAESVLVKPTNYHVSLKTIQRIRNVIKKKTVCAWIEGEILEINGQKPSELGDVVNFNPWTHEYFFTDHNKEQIDPNKYQRLFFSTETRKAHEVLA